MTDCAGCGGPADFEVETTIKPLSEVGKEYAGDREGIPETSYCCLECVMKMGQSFQQLKDNLVCEEPVN